ncbi:hypothetical protein, partial [Vibrio sagamiensis]|uniref:hypothetical protein n=1 Tax=Vibrio sagamiensis TaxID=512650 RepID=UPI001C99961B
GHSLSKWKANAFHFLWGILTGTDDIAVLATYGQNKEIQPTRSLCMNRLSYQSCIQISPSNNSLILTIMG